MSDDDLDPGKICRDEDCEIDGVHHVHQAHRRLRRRSILIHRRPKRGGPLVVSLDDGRLPSAQQLLAERVLVSVGERPTMMQWIQRDIRDDYGEVTDRTIYRYVRKLVGARQLVKLDLGLAFAVYIRPTSKLLRDRAALRDYMISNADCIPTSTKSAFA